MPTRVIKRISIPLQNTNVSTRLPAKNTLVYTVTHAISSSYTDVSLYFPGQEMDLWYFVKLMGYLLLNGQVDRKTCQTYGSLSTYSESVTYPGQILAILTRLLTGKNRIIKLNLLRAFWRLCQATNAGIFNNSCKMKCYLRFEVFSLRHLGTLYTSAKKAISRS